MPRFERVPGWSRGRPLDYGERDRLRHKLQALMEGTRTVRDHISPQTGDYGLTVGQWLTWWSALTADVEAFTDEVSAGHSPAHLAALGRELRERGLTMTGREPGKPNSADSSPAETLIRDMREKT